MAKAGALHVEMRGRSPSHIPVGVRASPPHLLEPLWRLPGESVEQLARRAMYACSGAGVVVLWLSYADEVPARGTP